MGNMNMNFGRSASAIGSDYDRLLELRKMIVVADGRWRKEMEIVAEREGIRAKEKEKDTSDIEKLSGEVQRLRGENNRLKKDH